MSETTRADKLMVIQTKLKAPKSQYNNFGKYNYRNCEDILEALKPLLQETETALVLTDDVVEVAGRHYVRATATLSDNSGVVAMCKAYAREAENKKGMDPAQVTGATSSYARKYALNGLFCIDDTKDADSLSPEQNNGTPQHKLPTPPVNQQKKDPRAQGIKILEQLIGDLHKRFPSLSGDKMGQLFSEWLWDNTDPQEKNYKKLPLEELGRLSNRIIGEKREEDGKIYWALRDHTSIEDWLRKNVEDDEKQSTEEKAA